MKNEAQVLVKVPLELRQKFMSIVKLNGETMKEIIESCMIDYVKTNEAGGQTLDRSK